jgi:hypothetical protein
MFCWKIIRGANIRGFLLLHVKCLCTKIYSTPCMFKLKIVSLKHDLLYYNRPVQKCNLSDPRRVLNSVRALFGDIIHLKFLSPTVFLVEMTFKFKIKNTKIQLYSVLFWKENINLLYSILTLKSCLNIFFRIFIL